MTDARWNLPEAWSWAAADDIASIVGGGTPSTRNSDNFSVRGIPWITPADLTGYRQTYIARGARDLSNQGYASSGAQLLPKGSVLFSSRAPIGYCAIAANELATNQGFKSLVLGGGIVPEYIRYYLLSAKDYAESLSSGTTFRELSGTRMATLLVPVAPTTEQRRIVAKLDGLLGRTARARKELDHVPKLVARYKQAILAAAFTGELTAEWREATDVGSPWERVDLGSVASDFAYGSSAKSAATGRVPVLRMGNIQNGRLDWSSLVYTSQQDEIEKYALKAGDVLFNRTNSPELVGKTALFQGEREAIFAGYIIRVRCGDRLRPDLLTYFLNSPAGRDYCWSVKTDGVSQSNINARKLAQFAFGLPTLAEQAEIVRRIKSAFAWLDKLGAEHARAAALLPKLEQAMLTKAFRGELMPQDPNDEPASALLERIRAARAVAPERKRKPRSSNLPRAPRRRAAMTKSRLDQDVMHQPYLAKHLRAAGGSAKVDDLFRAAELPVTDFYKQLAWEVEAGHINDQGAVLEAA